MCSRLFWVAVVVAMFGSTPSAWAQTRTQWQMHDGLEVTSGNPLGLLAFSCAPSQHGADCEYDVSTVPPEADPGWGAAPDGETIGLDVGCGGSRVCQAPGGQTCLVYGDFTYFQTLVDVPLNVAVTTFTIDFSGMDDGSRVSIFNSATPPEGLVVPGSYVYLGGSGTTNLASFIVAGEVNRVVVTQVDDCCCENHLHEARVVLNGQVVHTGCESDAACNDGDACTTDTCNADGSCSHTALSCDDQNLCTIDACDSQLGCVSQPLNCNDSSVCTSDSCDPTLGCVNSTVNCDDANPCTRDSCDAALGCQHPNQCPSCDAAAASLASIWPPNHQFVGVQVRGVVDPQGQTTTIAIDDIAQDEPTNTDGDGNTCVDGSGLGTSTAWVRAERAGTKKVPGDGRVYHISFTAKDPDGYACTGAVTTCVPHDQGNSSACVDEGPLYDSLQCH